MVTGSDLTTIRRDTMVGSCGGKGCKVIKLPFTTLPSWDTDHVEYKRA